MSESLFDLPPTKSKRASHREEVRELKERHSIWTHCCRGGGDWLALCLPACHAALKGYSLTEGEKENPIELMAGYCRLLDEAGLTHEGYKTELEAVRAAIPTGTLGDEG